MIRRRGEPPIQESGIADLAAGASMPAIAMKAAPRRIAESSSVASFRQRLQRPGSEQTAQGDGRPAAYFRQISQHRARLLQPFLRRKCHVQCNWHRLVADLLIGEKLDKRFDRDRRIGTHLGELVDRLEPDRGFWRLVIDQLPDG